MTARAGLTESESGEVAARGDLFQNGSDCLSCTCASRRHGGRAKDVHEINHGDRGIGFGERGDDGRERARA